MFRRTLAALAALSAAVALSIGTRADEPRAALSLPALSDVLVSCQAGAIYVVAEGGSRVVGCSAPPTSTSTPSPTATVTPGPTDTAGPSPTPSSTPTPVAEWWLAGGIDNDRVVGAWKAIGADSYSASLVNLAGGRDLYHPEDSPTWTAERGWQGGQHHHLAVTGGVTTTYGMSYFMKVKHAAVGSQQFMGCRRIWDQLTTGQSLNNAGGYQHIEAFHALDTNPLVIDGTMSIGGQGYYVNGVARNNPAPSPTPGGEGCTGADLFILSMSWGGAPYYGAAHGGSMQTEVQGVAVYSDTLTAGQAAALATAVAGW